ncbi:MAG TPA: Ig-like domain-containing protein [Polyangiaceae bacterium]|nr:Ig-like domain-containing protein [Polyangiaceae bacterium]
MSARSSALVVFVAMLAPTNDARAAPCGAADFLSALPPDGATSVPTNATLTAHYAAPASYDGEPVIVTHAPSSGDTPREPPPDFTVSFDGSESLLAVTFEQPLVAVGDYTVTWPRLHGSDHQGEGRGGKTTFRAGSETDTAFPNFGGFSSVAWDVVRIRDDCTDSLEDRFAFDLGLRSASDDGGRDSLELVVYQSTRLGARGDEVLHMPMPAKGDAVRVERALGDADGPVCFSAIVRDLTGKPSGGDAAGVCTTTIEPPFFYGCTTARHPSHDGGRERTVLVVGVAALIAARRRRR